ncbi:hypothetical protein Acsp03_27500 [Actinomadura sp. NBRC 104412]|uniref:hypothetical protein n=1 Tax=Actinomadura sp. NBRC 104412 TaxID=3032203 RepID=UPI0024A494AF|nr:hypothetical protein [Actinomadura sp. NBRC 104412]GLZ05284.1 hypothetical protein Acsp03_27500 [Actinomadura sp. NBRC 104412]
MNAVPLTPLALAEVERRVLPESRDASAPAAGGDASSEALHDASGPAALAEHDTSGPQGRPKSEVRSSRRRRRQMTPAERVAALRERLERKEGRARVRAEARTRKAERVSRQRLADLRQRSVLAGERARVRHQVAQSAEARALRVERTRTLALAVLLPVMAAFGAWSAAGVQAGMVTLLGLDTDAPAAVLAWLVEPALLGVVAGVILIRARLRSAGGDLDERATWIESGALLTSVLLNMAGHWPEHLDGAGLATLAGHTLGPVGAASTAFLISVVEDGVSRATPWLLANGEPAPTLNGPGDEAAPSPSRTREPAEAAAPRVPAPARVPAAENPVPDRVPVPDRPRQRPHLDGEPLRVRAAEVFATEMSAGEVPSIRRIKAALRCGQAKAADIQAYLSAEVSARVPASSVPAVREARS